MQHLMEDTSFITIVIFVRVLSGNSVMAYSPGTLLGTKAPPFYLSRKKLKIFRFHNSICCFPSEVNNIDHSRAELVFYC